MDLSSFHLIDPAVLESVRETVTHAVHAVLPAWSGDPGAPDFGAPDFGAADLGAPVPAAWHAPDAHDAPDGIELAQDKAPEKAPDTPPSTTPPEKKVVETDIAKKDTPGAGGPSSVDFSIWGIVSRADPIGKAVIALLTVASVWCWAIIFEKIIALRAVNARSDKFEDQFWSGGSVDTLYDDVGRRPNSPIAALFAAAMREWRQSTTPDHTGQQTILGGVKERIERVMHVTLGREMARLERNVGFLATVGATAPFIGLFGTVWGIMNAFQGIAIQKNTNLATVAPGISEALFATALGLLAAIPAVIAYNRFSGELDRYAHRLEAFTGEFTAIVSRQIEGGVR
jgi:biopolymer transport protein TolQ